MQHNPYSFGISLPKGIPTKYDNHITRTLSAMEGQFADQQALRTMLSIGDTVLYEVYEIRRPEVAGEYTHF